MAWPADQPLSFDTPLLRELLTDTDYVAALPALARLEVIADAEVGSDGSIPERDARRCLIDVFYSVEGMENEFMGRRLSRCCCE